MTYTTNYTMNKPAGSDPAAIGPLNENFEIIDTVMKQNEDNITAIQGAVIDEIDKNTSSESGSVVTLTDEAPSTPLKSCVCDIEPVQASGTPSPDNPLAISGWSGVNVVANGINYLDYDDTATPRTSNCSISISDYVITVTTTGADAFFGDFQGNTISNFFGYSRCKMGETYKLVVSNSNFAKNYVSYFDDNGTFLSVVRVDLNSFTVPIGASYMGFRIGYGSSASGNTYTLTVMCVKSTETSTDFEPYNGSTTTLTWTDAGIVYGGSIDLTSGVLRVTYMGVDLGDLTWSANAQDSYAFNSVLPSASVNGNNLEFICSSYVGYTSTTLSNYDYGISISQDGTRVYVKNKDYPNSDINAFKTASQGVTFVYKLATPVTYQLTPQTIKTLSSSPTNLWADTGDTAITYVVKDKYSNSGIPTVEAVKAYIAEMLGI